MDKHPVQSGHHLRRQQFMLRTEVTLRAYEVYCHVYGEQKALIEGNCRGGFGKGELIAFLYARSFPKEEWRVRVKEAFDGMEHF